MESSVWSACEGWFRGLEFRDGKGSLKDDIEDIYQWTTSRNIFRNLQRNKSALNPLILGNKAYNRIASFDGFWVIISGMQT